MKRNLDNFTRGSQLLGHFGFMFAAGLKGPAIIAVVALGWMGWWMLSTGLSDHEVYLVWMRVYAAGYTFMEFDPHKNVAIETVFGSTVHLPIGYVQDFPPVLRAWHHMVRLMGGVLLRVALLLAPAFGVYYWFATRFGRQSAERKHERGATMATLPELVAEIDEHNREERARELEAILGWRWRLCTPRELRQVLPYEPSRLAGVTYPWRLEQSHAMLAGTTGMGKTVALSDMVEDAKRRGQRAVIFDLTGTFIEHFYDSARDTILNPLDARCPQWSVFDECSDEAEFTAAAEALVPHDGGGAEQFWVLAARLLFVEMCLKLRARGQTTNEALAAELMTADLAAVHRLMRGTVADPLTAPEAARMAESIRAVFNANAKSLKLLPRTGRRFSIRQWIEEDQRDGSALFISARYVDMSVSRQLLTAWLDIAMNTLMAMERTRELRLWFFLDELGALHRLPALENGLQTARNFGGAIVTGIHAFAKLKEVYGENIARTLSSLARTKLILGTGDPDTATWCSDFLGHQQVRDKEVGYTYGYNNARDAVSLTSRSHIEPLQMPAQLMNLRRLTGYLKFADGFPAAPVKLVPTNRQRRAEPFIRRPASLLEMTSEGAAAAVPATGSERTVPVPAQPQETDDRPSSNDDGAGKPAVARQGELALDLPSSSAKPGDAGDRHLQAAHSLHAGAVTDGPTPIANPGSAGSADPVTTGPVPEPAAMALPAVMRASGGEAAELQPTGALAGTAASPLALGDGKAPMTTVASQRGAVDARKLLVEDGLPSAEPVHRDIGEADIEI